VTLVKVLLLLFSVLLMRPHFALPAIRRYALLPFLTVLVCDPDVETRKSFIIWICSRFVDGSIYWANCLFFSC